ncbi:hypothetical protein JD969_16905 [Planctomycetota bacterium]|nr:hypothetical protein JD969_16905 [Planctomycetota bacterium]
MKTSMADWLNLGKIVVVMKLVLVSMLLYAGYVTIGLPHSGGDEVTALGITSNKTDRKDKSGKQQSTNTKAKKKSCLATSFEQYKTRNIFQPIPDTSFKGQLVGILEDRAVFNNGEGKVGDRIMGAEIVKIGNGWVEIKHNDQKRKLTLWESAVRSK